MTTNQINKNVEKRNLTKVVSAFFAGFLLLFVGYVIYPQPEVQTGDYEVRKQSYNSPIRVVFNQPMNKDSVEKSFKIEPEVEGDLVWEGNVLILKPKMEFNVGDKYEVKIGNEAKNWLGKAISQEYSEVIEISKPVEIVVITPNNGLKNVPEDKVIDVVFSRPVISLKDVEQMNFVPKEFSIEPKINGKGMWVSPTLFRFMPEKLQKGTRYMVKFEKGFEAFDGSYLESGMVSEFETAAPKLISISNEPNQFLSKSSLVIVHFNQDVDLKSVKEKIEIYEGERCSGRGVDKVGTNWNDEGKLYEQICGKKYEEVEISNAGFIKVDLEKVEKTEENFGNKVEAEVKLLGKDEVLAVRKKLSLMRGEEFHEGEDLFENSESLIAVKPRGGFKQNKEYRIIVNEGVKSKMGNLVTKERLMEDFLSENGLEIFDSVNGGNGEINVSSSLALDVKSLEGRVKIEPEEFDFEGKPVEITNFLPSEWLSNLLSISYPLKHQKSYALIFKPGIRDFEGNELKEELRLEFTTPEVSPFLNLVTDSDFVVLNGYSKNEFFVKSVNVDSFSVNLGKISKDDLLNRYKSGYISKDYLNFDLENSVNESIKIEKKPNETVFTRVDLDKINGGKLENGFYIIGTLPSDKNLVSDYGQKSLFVVANAAVAVKDSPDEWFGWVSDLKTGESLKGVGVEIVYCLDYSCKDRKSLVTKTNGDGVFREKKEKSYLDGHIFVEGEGRFGYGYSGWSDGIARWNFGLGSGHSNKYSMFLYTDRSLYSPGDEVYFKGILRKFENGEVKLPQLKTQEIEVSMSNVLGEVVGNEKVKLSENGTFWGKFVLPRGGFAGDFSIYANGDADGDEGINGNTMIYVAEYVKPDYRVLVESDKSDYSNGEKAKLKVKSELFAGVPLRNGKVKWSVKSSGYYFYLIEEVQRKLGGKWFAFNDESYFCYFECPSENSIVSNGVGELKENGEFEMELPLNVAEKKTDQIYTFEVTITDVTGKTVSGRKSFTVNKAEYKVGVGSEEYIFSKGKNGKFEILTMNTKQEAVAGKKVKVVLAKRNWETVKTKNVDGGYYFENKFNDEDILSKEVTTDINGLANVEFLMEKAGSFVVRAESVDGRGNMASSALYVYVGGENEGVNWGRNNNDKIELVGDKNLYKVNDKARILVKSPYENVKALLTVEREKVLEYRVVELKGNSDWIELPILDSYKPNVFVSVVLLKGSGNSAGLIEPVVGLADEREVAMFKVGYLPIQVDVQEKLLGVEIKTEKEVYKPQEEVMVEVRTVDRKGGPVESEVSLMVVDESLLSMLDNFNGDLLRFFYANRGLEVNTAHTLVKALSRLNVQVEAGLKGGGGGLGKSRREFKDLAYFVADVKTGKDGIGKTKFKVPDNLTSWQIIAVGVSTEKSGKNLSMVGSNRKSIKVNKDLMIRTNLPRFAYVGDVIQMSFSVVNGTEKKMVVDSKLSDLQGIEVEGKTNWTFEIEPGKEKKVSFVARIVDEGMKNVQISASAEGGYEDAVLGGFMVYVPSLEERTAMNGVIYDDGKEEVFFEIPKGADINFGEVKAYFSNRVGVDTKALVDGLLKFPYECAEQLSSTLVAYGFMNLNSGDFDESEINFDKVKEKLLNLYRLQNGNGLFGLWENSDVNIFVSGYVKLALDFVSSVPFGASSNVFNSEQFSKLKGQLKVVLRLSIPNEFGEFDYSTFSALNMFGVRKSEFGYNGIEIREKEGVKTFVVSEGVRRRINNLQAFLAYVLKDEVEIGVLNNLFERREKMGIGGKLYLANALQFAYGQTQFQDKALRSKIDELRNELMNYVQFSAKKALFIDRDLDAELFDTNVKKQILFIQIMMGYQAYGEDSDLLPQLLNGLLSYNKGGTFGNTNDDAFVLMFLGYMRGGEAVGLMEINDIGAGLGGEKNEMSNSVKFTDLLVKNNKVSFSKRGAGMLFYGIDLIYYLQKAQIKPESRGIEVVQKYYEVDDLKMENEVNEFKTGKALRSKIVVIAQQDLQNVMIEDFLPAGLEAVDMRLNTSEQNLESEDYDDCYEYCYFNDFYFTHFEIRNNRVMIFADRLRKGVYEFDYLVRGGLPGTYVDLPTVAKETYYPEIFGRSGIREIVVND